MKKVFAMALVVCMSFLMYGCSEKVDLTSEETPVTDQVAVEASETTEALKVAGTESVDNEKPVIRLQGSDTGLPNPFRHHTRGPGMSKMQLLYDSLLEIDEKGYIPWLAKSYEVNEDGTVYSFNLVENAFWHDGTPLTVADVIFTMDYYRVHPPVTDNLTVDGEFLIKSVEKTGDWSFDIEVNHADNTYLSRLGGVRILPKHIWAKVEDPIAYEGDGAVVGSGPFKMTHYDSVKGEYRYEATQDYWGLEPAVAAIEWVPVSDAVMAFENGEIDLVNMAPDLLERYRSDDTYLVRELPSYHSYRLMMNMESSEALKDKTVRKAMAYGINRQALVDKIARGAADVSSMGYVPSTSKWYNPAIESYDYDLEKAKTFLNGRSYSFKLLTGNTPSEIKLAELIQLDLEQIGIAIEIESVESKTRDQAVKSGQYQLLLINSGGMGGDPDYLRSIYGNSTANTAALSAATLKGYYNEQVTALSKEQASVMDEAVRETIIDEMQVLIAEDVPMLMLYTNHDNFVYRPAHYDGWFARMDHSKLDHNKLSYVIRNK